MSLTPEFLKSLSATNAQQVSARSFRFDVPTSSPSVLTRVKLTATKGKAVRITLSQVVETEVIDGVPLANIEAAIGAALAFASTQQPEMGAFFKKF